MFKDDLDSARGNQSTASSIEQQKLPTSRAEFFRFDGKLDVSAKR
jgi:hypothetical protein